MTTDITPERIAELRQQHTPSVVYHDKKVCPKCSYEEYPCTMLALLDALEEAHGTASACYGQEMCRGFRDTYEVVARQRDQLRAENERLRAALTDALHELGNHWTRFGVPTERWRALKKWGDEPIHDDAERQWVLAWRAFTRGKAALAASPEQEASQ